MKPTHKKLKPGPPPKYPWVKWFGSVGHVQKLSRGKQYDCQPHAIAIQARVAAKKLKMRLSVHIAEDIVTLIRKA